MVKQRSRKSGPKSGNKSTAQPGPKPALKAPPRVQDLPAHAAADEARDELDEDPNVDEPNADADELDAVVAETDADGGEDAGTVVLDEVDADADADGSVTAEDESGADGSITAEDESSADEAAASEIDAAREQVGEGLEDASAAREQVGDGPEHADAAHEPVGEGLGDADAGAASERLSEGTDEPQTEPAEAPGPASEAADDPLTAMLAEFDAPRPVAPAGVKLSDELPIDPEDDLRQIEGEASPRLVSIIESLLFAAAKPLRVQDLRKLLAETSKHQIQLALKHLIAATAQRGVVLAQVAGGFQYRTHPDNAVWVQKMLQARPARLSRTQIETLAIVAYRQPITRPEIDDVRGVDSGAVLKTLLERDLIQIVGRKEEPGRPLLYGTTVRFLEFFNLRSLRDLPTLRDFRDLSDESKATLRARLGQTEAEALGQEVLGLPDAEGEASDEDGDEASEAVGEDQPAGEAVDPETAASEPDAEGDAHERVVDEGAAEVEAAGEADGGDEVDDIGTGVGSPEGATEAVRGADDVTEGATEVDAETLEDTAEVDVEPEESGEAEFADEADVEPAEVDERGELADVVESTEVATEDALVEDVEEVETEDALAEDVESTEVETEDALAEDVEGEPAEVETDVGDAAVEGDPADATEDATDIVGSSRDEAGPAGPDESVAPGGETVEGAPGGEASDAGSAAPKDAPDHDDHRLE